mmetsp:Transcript_15303/g.22590  ORF Transcript_15303/g.22590 Transcript_15303/m.22590 type:complete len:95 (-) Transcript_15303:595-879(-)
MITVMEGKLISLGAKVVGGSSCIMLGAVVVGGIRLDDGAIVGEEDDKMVGDRVVGARVGVLVGGLVVKTVVGRNVREFVLTKVGIMVGRSCCVG